MCGIVGFITNETHLHEQSRANFLKQSLIVDTLRGDDSTGVFGVQHDPVDNSGPYWCKEVSDGYQFTQSDAYLENFWDVSGYRAAVGHNRAATSGGVDAAGAHPFVVGPITLVHNGTLSRVHNLPLPMRLIEDCQVDSHAIAHNLAEHSVEDVVAKLDGAFTLVWHDARDDSMNIIRNSKRPMHIAKGDNQETLFFASEGGMLDFIAQRVHIKLGPIFYPKEGQHLKWLPDTELSAPIVKELDLCDDDWGKPYTTSYGMGGYWDNTRGVWVDDEDDDDWRNDYAVSNTRGKYEPPADDKVWVGGRKQDIPMLLQEELLKYDLVVEDRVTFTPKVSLEIEENRVQIFGMLPGGYKAVIYSTLKATASFMHRDWTIRPIAAYVKPSGEPTIIVKLVSTHGVSSPATTTTVEDKEKGMSVMGYDINGDGEEMMYVGMHGKMMGRMEWLDHTEKGCEFCSADLMCEDHKRISWINNGTMPLCENCTLNVYDKALDEEIPYE